MTGAGARWPRPVSSRPGASRSASEPWATPSGSPRIVGVIPSSRRATVGGLSSTWRVPSAEAAATITGSAGPPINATDVAGQRPVGGDPAGAVLPRPASTRCRGRGGARRWWGWTSPRRRGRAAAGGRAGLEAEWVSATMGYEAARRAGGLRHRLHGHRGAVLAAGHRRWAETAASLVAPGGFLYSSEFHPFLNVFGWETPPRSKTDYFRARPLVDGEPGSYVDFEAETVDTSQLRATAHPRRHRHCDLRGGAPARVPARARHDGVPAFPEL